MDAFAERPYVDPAKHGLTPLGEIDRPDVDYEFEIFASWKHEDGRLFWADDSGCSCPAPFEDYKTLADLQIGTAKECAAAIDRWIDDSYASDWAKAEMRKSGIALKERIRQAVRS